MVFKITPGRDWVEQINKFMDDYNGFSNGWQDAGKREDSVKRWGMDGIRDGFVGINGVKINGCFAQKYIWNKQPLYFLQFNITIPTLKTGNSFECIQLPFEYSFCVGFVDCVTTTAYLRAQGANTTKLNLANDSGVDATGNAWGELILI